MRFEWGDLILAVLLAGGMFFVLFLSVLPAAEPDCAGVRTHVQLLAQHRATVEAALANVVAERDHLKVENERLRKALEGPKPAPSKEQP